MKKILFTIIFSLIFIRLSYSQNYEKIIVDSHDNLFSYYLIIKPKSSITEGVLVLFPGFGQRPESIFTETKLQNTAYANGILIIALSAGNKLYAGEGMFTV